MKSTEMREKKLLNSISEMYDEHLENNHLQLDDSVIRRREISNSLMRKAQENLYEKPAKLHRSQLEPNDLNVLTTQDVNAILVFVDFEEAIHSALRKTWPSVKVKVCRFNLGQSCWRMIQSVGLASKFRVKDSEIGRALKHLFSLPYLPPSEVLDCFTYDLLAIKPNDDKVDKVFDYIFENYIMPDSRFSPEMWAECSSSLFLTTNGCEAFHSKFNKEFKTTHPNIFKVIDILTNIQSETLIKPRNYFTTLTEIEKKQKLVEKIIYEFSSLILYYKLFLFNFNNLLSVQNNIFNYTSFEIVPSLYKVGRNLCCKNQSCLGIDLFVRPFLTGAVCKIDPFVQRELFRETEAEWATTKLKS
ncbi:hypothetical protein QTP88_004072 [Uroleucon formosanum]